MNKFLPLLVILIIFNMTNVYGTTNFSLSTISQDDLFGYDVESLGDLDGDGINDMAVGSPNDNDGGKAHGAVYILFLNSDGTVKSSQKISSTEGNFKGVLDSGDCWGNAITSLNDFDGDGITDIAVGAHKNYSPGSENKRIGAVHILLLNSDGTVKSSQEISDTRGNFDALNENDTFGIDLTNLNDLDGDGITDIAVGANGDSEYGLLTGAVYILFLNSDGTVKSYQKISSEQSNSQLVLDDSDMFGSSVGSIGDLDGDGITDLVVGSPGDDDTKELIKTVIEQNKGSSRGAVYILFLNSDGTVKSSQKISSTEGNFKQNLQPPDVFGFSSSSIGDLDGDGITDISVGSPHRHYYDSELSPLHILFLENDGTVKSFNTLPMENKSQIDYEIFLLLGTIFLLIIIPIIIIKIKFKNSESKLVKNSIEK